MLDRTEIAILRVLEEDARLSYAELADKVALSKTCLLYTSPSPRDS